MNITNLILPIHIEYFPLNNKERTNTVIMMQVEEVFINEFTLVEKATQTIAYSTNTCNFFLCSSLFHQKIILRWNFENKYRIRGVRSTHDNSDLGAS